MKTHWLLLFTLWAAACRPGAPASEPAADDWPLSGFVKVDSLNPILQPDSTLTFTCPLRGEPVHWEARNVLNPAAVVKDDQIYLFYRAQDPQGTSRIGLAVSNDGLHFEKRPAPVFYPDEDIMKTYEWRGRTPTEQANSEECYFCYFDGVEDPRIVETDDGRYLMTYTAYDGKTARLASAGSRDLLTWKKYGLVLGEGKYRNTWSKAGAIVARREDHRMIAAKILDKYWMYYGDTDLFMVTSDDLITWTAEEDEEKADRLTVLHPRPGYFDSRLVEPGPYALLREAGILLIYNASNAANFNDPELPKFTYAAGQALFDAAAPYRLLDRTDTYFIYPDKPYERVGEVNEVCFVEGLVYFRKKWFLYYGTADSRIAVAVRG